MKVTNVFQVFHVIFFSCFNLQQVVTFPYCPTSRPTPNSTVHFVNEDELVPKVVHGCIMISLSFRCCMADYVSVQWFQKTKDGTWEDFLHTPVKTVKRELGTDDNQTAILMAPWDHGLDDGTYKCVGNGTRPGDTIEHAVTVNLRQCPDIKNGTPFPFFPDEEESNLSMELSTNITVVCGAVFGTQCSIPPAKPDCTFQWEKIGRNGTSNIPAGNSTSGRRVYYESNVSASSVNDRTSVLYINDSVESDYGTYVCKMENKFGNASRRITIKKRGVIVDHSANYVGIAAVMALAFVFIVSIVGYQFRWHISLRWNEVKHGTACYHGGKLRHDILLLHTNSVTIDTNFARYCKRKMEQLGYDVIFEDDIPGGQNTISEWLKRSDESQYVVIVLSPDFLTDEDENCRLPLRNIIRRKANFLFVLFRFTVDTPMTTRMRDIKAAIQIKPNIRWSANATAFDGNSSENFCEQLNNTSADKVNVFWRKLTSYLPQPLQTDTATEVSALLSKSAAGKQVAPESA